ncbi:hypothetical protein HAX54_042718 [Datura stramonium]|uniref:Uncharacterized protein n=1 Tax=Datura stramonium TaxID=4076 RepID=A0ABS8SM55_DATST|nr:hypothetical protein [Datura stramonium]
MQGVSVKKHDKWSDKGIFVILPLLKNYIFLTIIYTEHRPKPSRNIHSFPSSLSFPSASSASFLALQRTFQLSSSSWSLVIFGVAFSNHRDLDQELNVRKEILRNRRGGKESYLAIPLLF